MREVEVKYAIESGTALTAIAAVEAAGGAWAPAVRQDDQAYAETGWDFDQPKAGRRFARLRTENGQHWCTIKVPQSSETDCLETEWAVDDRNAADVQLHTDGFRPTVRIVKTRRIARWSPLTLCLDTIEGLGTFLEAEMLVPDDQDGPGIQAQLKDRLATLDIALIPVAETYDTLLHRQWSGRADTAPRSATDTVP